MITISDEEAKKLQNLSNDEKLPELIFLEFHKQVLKGRKLDTMEKTKYRIAIRFTVDLIKKNL